MMRVRVKPLLLLLLALVMVIGLAVLGSLSLSSGLDPRWSIGQALDSLEGALSSIEEIQTAEDLEEAQDLAADAEQDLRDAISILEDIEIPNWLWLPQQGALYWHGPILDRETEQPVEAAVFVNGYLIAQGVTEVAMLMWATQQEPVWVEIKAPGYKTWGLRFRFQLLGLEVIEGPVWLVRE